MKNLLKKILAIKEPIEFDQSFFLFIDGPDPLMEHDDAAKIYTENLCKLVNRFNIVHTYVFDSVDLPDKHDIHGIGEAMMLLPGMTEEIYKHHKLATVTNVTPMMRVVWFERT